ncbi:hypothetical protein [Actinomycetospora aeridis]|uniref:Uncharacterized protein n=1 Tax=Actinomycetospora aeridis TaxID=3129231 RepID=A0ABU8N4Y0_9PSEU
MAMSAWCTWFSSDLLRDDRWPGDRPAVASCPDEDHDAPAPGCFCGWWAVAEPGDRMEAGDVLGVVELSGRVRQEHEIGRIRASHARPRLLVVGPSVPQAAENMLAARFGVPVHRTRIPVTRLARYLGERPDIAGPLTRTPPAVSAFLDRVGWWEARSTMDEVRERAADTPERRDLRRMRGDGTLGRAALRGFVLLAVWPAGTTALFTWMARSQLEDPATFWDQLVILVVIGVVLSPVCFGLLGTVDTLTAERPVFGVKTILGSCSGVIVTFAFRLVAYGPQPSSWWLLVAAALITAFLAGAARDAATPVDNHG